MKFIQSWYGLPFLILNLLCISAQIVWSADLMCTISIDKEDHVNEVTRRKIVKTAVKNNELEIIDLTEGEPSQIQGSRWIKTSCNRLKAIERTCDIVVISAHPLGGLIGREGRNASWEDLNSACDEIRTPKSVYWIDPLVSTLDSLNPVFKSKLGTYEENKVQLKRFFSFSDNQSGIEFVAVNDLLNAFDKNNEKIDDKVKNQIKKSIKKGMRLSNGVNTNNYIADVLALPKRNVIPSRLEIDETSNASYQVIANYKNEDFLTRDELVDLSEREYSGTSWQKMKSVLEKAFSGDVIYPNGSNDDKILRVMEWNIERGEQLEAQKALLSNCTGFLFNYVNRKKNLDSPSDWLDFLNNTCSVQTADILILNEVDMNMCRSGYKDISLELAKTLGMNYVFGAEFIEVDPLKLGLKKDKNRPCTNPDFEKGVRNIIGNTILSPYKITNPRTIQLSKQYDWFEKEYSKDPLKKIKDKLGKLVVGGSSEPERRRGSRNVVLAQVHTPQGKVLIVNAHLENNTGPSGRGVQMEEVISAIRDYQYEFGKMPIILGGDLNTTGENSDNDTLAAGQSVPEQVGNAAGGILGGLVGKVISKFTDRQIKKYNPTIFEKPVFRRLEYFEFESDDNGDWSLTNETGQILSKITSYEPTFTTKRAGTVTQGKLDWLFIKNEDGQQSCMLEASNPMTAVRLQESYSSNDGSDPISDHRPILVEIKCKE